MSLFDLRPTMRVAGAVFVATIVTAAGLVATAVPIGAIVDDDPAATIVGDPPLAAPPDGEGLPADATTLYDVAGIAVHPWTGEVYWSDTDKHRIRRLDRFGFTWTVAGDGTAGVRGDGNDAREARLNRPRGLSFDGDGNLFIADSFNHRIRRIDTLGFMSTVAGGGIEDIALGAPLLATNAELSFPSDVDASPDGSFFVIADSGNHQVHRVNVGGIIFRVAGSTQGYSGDGGSATAAQLSFPEAVLMSPDQARIYISDLGNLRLRAITDDGLMSTVAGNGTIGTTEGARAYETGIGAIRDIAIDHQQNLYLTDHTSDAVRRIGLDDRVRTISGLGTGAFGTAVFQQYVNPSGVTFDRRGRLLIGDEDSIVRITPAVTAAPPARANPYGRPAEEQVRRLYRAAFGRVPEAGGLRFWVRRYQAGSSMRELAENFIASGESIAIYGENPTNEEFLTILYNNVLRRGPDSGGLAFWLSRLESGTTRAAVLEAFADSPENIENTGTAPPLSTVRMEVLRLYRAAFGRVPDAGGLDFWVARRNSGASREDLAANFIASPEASGYLDTSEDTLFIEALYGNVLRRNADTEGLRFWEAELRSGRSRASVLVEFSESSENRHLTGTA